MSACKICVPLFVMMAVPLVLSGQSKADAPATALSADQFDPLVKLILPAEERGETKWLAIPWMTDTLAARQKAAAEDKPMVVWSMSACPLGGD
jgi:hypothetical protein